MQQLEINLDVSPATAVKCLEAATKELAPQIRNWKIANDKSWFVCTVRHGFVYAVLRGEEANSGKSTKISVKVLSTTIWPLIVLLLAIGAFYLFIRHSTSDLDWIFVSIIVFAAIPWLMIPLSKSVLIRFIRDSLEDPIADIG